ncbi:MAG: hypothetical protein JST48_06270 [Bacteroidetes bacterium]|nr:hypothetical protein [Bacteroidota bacterium]
MTTTEDLIIEVGALTNWLAKKKPVTILDVRPKSERDQESVGPRMLRIETPPSIEQAKKKGADCVEMEASALYTFWQN